MSDKLEFVVDADCHSTGWPKMPTEFPTNWISLANDKLKFIGHQDQ